MQSSGNKIQRNLSIFYGVDEIPKTELANCTLKWLNAEEEESSGINKDSLLNRTNVEYKFNSHGYRCSEFDSDAENRILAIGCSLTLGVGLPYHKSWPYRFYEMIRDPGACSTVLWNLGMFGESNDYIARMLKCAVAKLKPTIVIVLFTGFSRREYVDLFGDRLVLGPFIDYKKVRGYRKELVESYFKLQSEYADCMNFIKNYTIIENLLNAHGVRWLFSFPFTELDMIENVLHFVDRTKCVHQYLRHWDLARDNLHPGIESNRLFAEAVYTTYSDTYGNRQQI